MADNSDAETWDRLLQAIREVDPVPPDVTALAEAALKFAEDIDVAKLTHDSWIDATTAVRSGDTSSRVVEFTHGATKIEVAVDTAKDPGATGHVDPVVGTAVVVETPRGETARAEIGPHGDFFLESLPTGPVRIKLLDRSRPVVASAWVVLRHTP